VWEKFKEMKAHEERATRFYDVLVYILYVVGWGLAILSRLYGGGESIALE